MNSQIESIVLLTLTLILISAFIHDINPIDKPIANNQDTMYNKWRRIY